MQLLEAIVGMSNVMHTKSVTWTKQQNVKSVSDLKKSDN